MQLSNFHVSFKTLLVFFVGSQSGEVTKFLHSVKIKLTKRKKHTLLSVIERDDSIKPNKI